MSIENIQFLLSKLDQEHTSHLQIKAELSQEIKKLTQKELNSRKTLTELQAAISSMVKRPYSSKDADNISQLVITVNDLENEVKQNRQHATAVETEFTHERIQLGMIKNKINLLKSEKEELKTINAQKKQEQQLLTSESQELQNKRERLEKLRKQIEKQEHVKQNLSNFLYISNLVEQIIQSNSTIDKEEESNLEGVSTEIIELIIEAREAFIDAQSKFSPNDLTPFLKDSYHAFKLGLKSWILLSEESNDNLIDQPFPDQVFALVNKGLSLNTRHLAAVESMLQKIQKGVEIAPLASFSNEIREFFTENLSLLRVHLSNEE